MGCGHAGVVNIMQKEKYRPCFFCIGGFICSIRLQKSVSKGLLDDIVMELKNIKTREFLRVIAQGRQHLTICLII